MTINTIVIDIETLDTAPTAAILSIGAFAFDRFNLVDTQANIVLKASSRKLYYNIDITKQLVMLGRSISTQTLTWWNSQNHTSRESLIEDQEDLKYVLQNLAVFINRHELKNIYFRGPDFDGSILESAFDACGIECPWKYNQKRDVRTYIDAMYFGNKGTLPDYKPCFNAVTHNALDDAMCDAEQMCLAYEINKSVK